MVNRRLRLGEHRREARAFSLIGEGTLKLMWPRHGALRSRGYQRWVFAEHSSRINWRPRFPVRHPLLDFCIADFNFEQTLINFNPDDVALAHRSNGSSQRGFGRHVADHQATRSATEAAIGEQCD